eukprot:gene6276-8643_t
MNISNHSKAAAFQKSYNSDDEDCMVIFEKITPTKETKTKSPSKLSKSKNSNPTVSKTNNKLTKPNNIEQVSDATEIEMQTAVDSTNTSVVEKVVEKILGKKSNSQQIHLKLSDSLTTDTANVDLYFVKWKNLSFIHAEWLSADQLSKCDPSAKLKIKRFNEITLNNNNSDEYECINAELTDVQRIISCNRPVCIHSSAQHFSIIDIENDDNLNEVKYLVKWRGLSYDESTWEYWTDIKKISAYEVWMFWQTQKPPTFPIKQPKFPSLQEYENFDSSPSFGNYSDANSHSLSSKEELVLRDYQLAGLNWLLWNWWNKKSCILADEKGLGKTIQTICFLHQLRYMITTKLNGPFLIICPVSLIDHWQNEIATWAPEMNCVVLYGNQTARNIIMENDFYYQYPFVPKDDAVAFKKASVVKFNILLTTFEIATKDIRILSHINWKVLIIDEAHKLKNYSSRLFTTLSTIPTEHSILLSSTPLQHKVEELWSLLHFVNKKEFSNLEEFMINYGDLNNSEHVEKLNELLKPHLLRRIRENVESSLHKKIEIILEVYFISQGISCT